MSRVQYQNSFFPSRLHAGTQEEAPPLRLDPRRGRARARHNVEARQAAVAPMASTTGLSGKSRDHLAAARYLSKQASSSASLPRRASRSKDGRILNSWRSTAFGWVGRWPALLQEGQLRTRTLGTSSGC